MLDLSTFFQTQILFLREKYQWLIKPLAELNMQVEKIANFGCGEGRETFALMCILGAGEATGVDRDDQSIQNAQSTLESIRQMTLVKGVPNDAPDFLKRLRREEVVKFYPADITRSTPLQPDDYDIAFCDCVLYHIWLDQGGEEKTQKAIEEMARVVRPDGVVAAREPTQRTGELTFDIDFRPLFEQTGLKPIHVEEIAYESGRDTEYLYLKETAAYYPPHSPSLAANSGVPAAAELPRCPR